MLSFEHEHHDEPGEILSRMKAAASPGGAPIAAAAVAGAIATTRAAGVDAMLLCVHTTTSF